MLEPNYIYIGPKVCEAFFRILSYFELCINIEEKKLPVLMNNRLSSNTLNSLNQKNNKAFTIAENNKMI